MQDIVQRALSNHKESHIRGGTEEFEDKRQIIKQRQEKIKSLVLDREENLVDREELESRLNENGLSIYQGDVVVEDGGCLSYHVGREALHLVREKKHPEEHLKDIKKETLELVRCGFCTGSIRKY
jgi:hypothetical protein